MAELPDIPTELSYDGRMIDTKIVHTLRQVIKPVDTALNGSTVSFNIPNDVGELFEPEGDQDPFDLQHTKG